MLHKGEIRRGQSAVFKGIWVVLTLLLTVLTITVPAGNAFSASATVSWTAPTTNTDGSALTDLSGYKIYYGTASATYSHYIDVANVTSYTVSGLTSGTYYFVVTAYDTEGYESVYSNEVSRNVSATTYTITGSAGSGGSISPSGSTSVTSGGSQTYTITPSSGYQIANVLVDGVSVGAVSSYTFSNVTAGHTISATFSAVQVVTYTITGSAGSGGSISPSGSTSVTSGSSQTYTITPSTGYKIANVLVDGVSVGAVSSYAFSNVTANHTIAATFSTLTYTITASAGTGGSISPSGSATVNYGGSQTYTITPSTGYAIASVLVDGVSVGAVGSYSFSNVTAGHTISATFAEATGEGTKVTLNPVADTTIILDGNNYSASTELMTYTWPTGYVANTILMKFDLSSIPANATITDAKLNLYLLEADSEASYTNYNLTLNRIINFDADLSQATGYQYDGTNAWTANANSYNGIPLAQSDITAAYDTQSVNQTAGYKTWNATQLIKDWLAAPETNLGLAINSDALAPCDAYRMFASSKHSNTGYVPYLTVTYTMDATASYAITSSASRGGSISPAGTKSVNQGGSVTYTIKPNVRYKISDVKVDGVSVGAVTSYTFSKVSANHKIRAVFVRK